ncbi:peptidoglycan recognition protein family protein [Streptosporangium sp. H16]|uniref:peptidoglycan recognition protein family protein n=1 Tax=Streptosporangium sp. H16 TaxID=3444184 RepID=UPI003F7A632F
MTLDLVSRRSWGAREPRGSYDRLTSTKGVKIHYTGGHVDPATLADHGQCVAAVRGIQGGHMNGNGWMDVGYSLLVCSHRKVFVGRGLHRIPAANGPGLNSGHYAVLGLVGTSGVTEPPDAMLHGIRDAIEYLRDEGGAGKEIKGHRDGYATSCPGGPLYAWVKRGAPRPVGSGSASDSIIKEEDDVPEIVSLGAGRDQAVPAGGVLAVRWHTEFVDDVKGHGADGAAVLAPGSRWVLCDALVKLRGLPPGAEVDVAWSRYDRDGKTFEDDAWALTFTADPAGRVEASVGGQFALDTSNQLRLKILNPGPNEVTVEKVTMAKIAMFKR